MAGDGSIQLNIQELQTIVHHQLLIKIFVMNNGGYLSIRTTQQSFFAGNLVGEGPSSGVSFPDMARLAEAYGIPPAESTRSIAAPASPNPRSAGPISLRSHPRPRPAIRAPPKLPPSSPTAKWSPHPWKISTPSWTAKS